MLTGFIRPIETRIVDIPAGAMLPERNRLLEEACPPGWEVSTPHRHEIRRVDGVEEIEAPDFASLRARVPEGWQLVSMLRP